MKTLREGFTTGSCAAAAALACCLLGAVEPLLNPVWVMIFDGETPGIFALIGGIIVIVAVTAWCVWDGKQPKAAAGSAPQKSL